MVNFSPDFVTNNSRVIIIFIAVYKRTTVNVFKAHGMAQASIADCVNETFSAIRTVSDMMLYYLVSWYL